MKKITLFAALCAGVLSLSAGEVKISKPNVYHSLTRKIAIDSTKDYTLTINAKGGKGKLTVTLYQFNKDQRRIGAAHVWGKADTLTEIVGPAICGAKEFIVKDASKWIKPRSGTNIVGFKAKSDFSDLPNFTIDYYISNISKQNDGTWKIEMKTPLRRSHASGTLVRQHYDGGHLTAYVPLPVSKPYTVTIKVAKGLGPHSGTWWPGAAFVQISARTADGTPVTITDWSLKEVSAK